MGLLKSLFGAPERAVLPLHVTGEAVRSNLLNQLGMLSATMGVLRPRNGVSAQPLKLEFFFYTDAEHKARALADTLQGLHYEAATRTSAGNRRLHVINGWTTPIEMSEESLAGWTQEMCRLGLEHDCDFDGWGTNLKH